jgi:hypothetical protein
MDQLVNKKNFDKIPKFFIHFVVTNGVPAVFRRNFISIDFNIFSFFF